MKIKTSTFTAFTKAIVVLFCITIGFTSFTTCYAQSIVGKWKLISSKNYYSAEGAKMVGKQVVENFAKDIGDEVIEYKADHTFIIPSCVTNGQKTKTTSGTWSLTGDQLTSVDNSNSQKKGGESATATISINGNTMVVTQKNHPPNNEIISKFEATFKKM